MDPNEQTPDAPDQEKMEQIRRRRVQKLANTSSPPPSQSTTPKAEGSSHPPSITDSKDNSSGAEHATEHAAEQGNMARPGVNINITSAATKLPDSGGASTTATPPPVKKPAAREETLEEYTDKALSHIFRISADPSRSVDSHGHKVTFLPGVSQDLEDDGEALKLSINTLDTAIIEACMTFPQRKPLLDYLLPCWKRVVRAIRALRGSGPAKDEKEAMLKEAQRLCLSNCIFAITLPDLFGRDADPQHDTLAPYLLRGIEDENGICLDFFAEAVKRIPDDETVAPMFVKAMVDISARLSHLTMNDDFKPHVNALLAYSKFPALLSAIAQHPSFQMAQSPPGIEKHTLLGPFFRISPLQGEVTRSYFPDTRNADKGRVAGAQQTLRITLATHQMDLLAIVNALVRAGIETRNRTLDWFAYVMNVNHKRRAIQVNPKELSSDGFMVNVTVILDQLCQPFMDATFSKIDRINVDYFRQKPRIDIKDETKLNADQSRSDAFYGTQIQGPPPNFISEVFFLTLAAHHYGTEATISTLKNLDRDIKFYEKHIKSMEAERTKFLNNPAQLALFETTLKRHTDVLEKSIALKFAIEGVLLDEKMQGRSLQFMRYVAVWLLRVASDSDYKPDQPLKLPLPKTQPEAFSCLPEYALQDVVDNLKFVFGHVPQVMVSAVGDEIIALCITFLESSEYVKNPYLKSSLVSLLFRGTWPTYHLRKGILGDQLTGAPFANEHLLHSLMKFYIECELTGAHTQFYDKFNIRYEIFQVIKTVWGNDVYKDQLRQQSKVNRQFFVQFVNLLLNDATYVMDEALTKFPKIHELQEELRKAAVSGDMSAQDREKTEEELQTAENQATSYMQLANETVAMMKLFTKNLSQAFTMPEIVQRLALMLDYNLNTLVGPKSRNLKVDNSEKYHFNPKTLLAEFVDIYLNLGNTQSFIEAVAADGRSYKPENFIQTDSIMKRLHLKDASELEAWKKLSAKVEKAKAIAEQAELDLGEVPSDFEDPILGDIMRDPVILPSKAIVDRSTIVQHLLSDPKDPFTRQPMTVDDVVPADELREKIEAWKKEKMDAAKAKITQDVMDTSGD